jgi:PTH1 family peptidyl-tRNA hydrolase
VWIVGLGNPGPRYAGTRHNVGLDLLLGLTERWDAEPLARARQFEAYRARLDDREIHLIAPLSYMNRSGSALAAFESWQGERPDPSRTLILCDDVYLPLGSLRLRARGTTGGHKGLASIEEYIGTPDYARLRIGVGGVSPDELTEHVLSTFDESEIEPIKDALERAELAVEVWAREGIDSAMNRFNRSSKEVQE